MSPYINFKKFFGRILAPPSGRRPGAAAPPRYATDTSHKNPIIIFNFRGKIYSLYKNKSISLKICFKTKF